jgi:hypothetical protein
MQKVTVEIGTALEKAPEYLHEKMITGKLHANFYSHKLLASMNFILSNEGMKVGDYWEDV